MPKTLEGFLSDDGQTFTSFVENDKNDLNPDDTQDGILDASDPISQLLSKVDVTKLPDDQRETFSRLVETVKGLKTELDGVKKDSGNAQVFQSLIDQIKTLKGDVKPDDKTTDRKKLVDQLTFDDPEKDYYAPHLKMLASAIDKMMDSVDGIGKRFDDNTKNTFVKDVQNFIKSNKIPEQVIKKMDEIAKDFGAGAYNNLERLHKYAKAELGIKDATVTRTLDSGKINRQNVVEFGGKRRSDSTVDNKPAKTMLEAWNRAEASLAEEE